MHRARNTEDDVRTIAGPWEGRRGLGDKLAVKLPALELKAGEISELSVKSSTQIRQVGRSAGRQVGRSAVSINLAPQGPARRLGRDYLSGDACFGPPWASNIPNGLTAETSAQLPWLGKLSHR